MLGDPQISKVHSVEKGIAPEAFNAMVLDSGALVMTWKICAYGMVSKYEGEGGVNSTASYVCAFFILVGGPVLLGC